MDTVTHGLTGWLIARAIPSEEGRKEATVAVVVGSLLPDADNVASLFGSELYLRIHRGISHSFAGVGVTSLLVALLICKYGKWKDLKKLFLLTLLGQLSHIALDLLNSYGTQIFQPFSDARVSFDLLFVIDLVFTGIIVLGLLLSRYRPSRARAALVVLTVYVGFAAFLHLRAEDAIRQAAVRHGVPVVSSWALPRLGEIRSLPDLWPGRRAEAAATPRWEEVATGLSAFANRKSFPLPAGPFAWNGFVDDGATYLRAEVDPLDGAIEWKERARKGRDMPEARALENLPDVRTYLWFARFPTVYVSTVEGKTVVTFFDLRFGGVTGRSPFVLRVIESPDRSPLARWGGT
ncbi:MAG TPA: metal-dependent hydrolase [Candidatus Limnocylindrales bacterium]|nr:metal-dependent hydrolase [Candidatus Limnocylindrales bacterium]